MSDLGGSLGFWIGMSVLSFVEILELLLLTCYTLGKKFKQRITSGGKVEAFTGYSKTQILIQFIPLPVLNFA